MRRAWNLAKRLLAVSLLLATASSCVRIDVAVLAADVLGGRDNGTPESQAARDYLVLRLSAFAQGANPAAGGTAAYLQPFAGGANVVAVIPGTELPDEYVIVGAHFDHLTDCGRQRVDDMICNGATDNATGVAAVLDIAAHVATHPVRRSVVVALWDREEDGLLGSRHYVANPLVPLADTVAYVNLDILGANLRPSLRDTTFAVGAETGGTVLTDMVEAATAVGPADTTSISAIFGQYRSDYFSFMTVSVPTVFFSDSTGPCYHTVDDDIGVVDFDKLDLQIAMARQVTRTLADADARPTYAADAPLATFDDVVGVEAVVARSLADIATLPPALQQQVADAHAVLLGIIAEGPAAFDSSDFPSVFSAVASLIDVLTEGPCDGFLESAPA